MLVFAILESCISFAAQEVMANATDDVARQLRTGQLLKADITEASLKKAICDRMEIMVAKGCPDLLVDLQTFRPFARPPTVKIKFTGTGEGYRRRPASSSRPAGQWRRTCSGSSTPGR